MDERTIVDKVNRLLEDTDFPLEVSDLTDIEDFLSDENNTDLEVYEEIENLYSQLMEDSVF